MLIDEAVFATGSICIGRFRCTPADPAFTCSGPIHNFCVVFPRTSVWIRHRGGQPFVADPSVATIYNKGQEYTRKLIAPEGDRCEWFGIAAPVLREIVATFDPAAADDESGVFRFTHAPCARRVYAAQRMIFNYATRLARPDHLFVEETVLNMIAGIVEAGYRQRAEAVIGGVTGAQRELVEHARAILAARVGQAITLAELSRMAGVSVFHLARVFARVTGGTIHQYRRELRVRRALELVIDARRDLLDVALQLGYSGHSHFTAEFRQAFGVTPSDWRKRASYPSPGALAFARL